MARTQERRTVPAQDLVGLLAHVRLRELATLAAAHVHASVPRVCVTRRDAHCDARVRDGAQSGVRSAAALTDKDYEDIKLAAEIGVDYLAVSFPRDERDMHEARTLVKAAGSKARLVAKIERAETVSNSKILDDIIIASDAVMVARGDLGVEIGDAQLTGVQKQIIKRATSIF